MEAERDLERMAVQERRLRPARFDADTAWALGGRLKALAEARGVAVAIEIRIAGRTVFFHALSGSTPANADWARRKRNTVDLVRRSSYAVGLEGRLEGHTVLESMALPPRDYAWAGGCFPLQVRGAGHIGVAATLAAGAGVADDRGRHHRGAGGGGDDCEARGRG